ncbi:MAG: AMP-binding protein, partial [Cyclobacteriaceae bacterium]
MTLIDKKIVSDYWSAKLSGSNSKQDKRYESWSVKNQTISKTELAYYERLTAGDYHTKFTVLLAIYGILLQRYKLNDLLVLSHVIADNRQPLLYDMPAIKERSLKAYLLDLKKEVEEVHRYSDFEPDQLPGNQLVDFTDFAFSYGNSPKHNWNLSTIPFHLSVLEKDDDLNVTLIYANEFVDQSLAAHFLSGFVRQMSNLEETVNEKAEAIRIVTREDERIQLAVFNDTSVAYPEEETVVSLFRAQAKRTPERIAVVTEERSYNYATFNELSDQMALFIQDRYEIGQGGLIGVLLPRSEWMLIAIYGIIKA